VATGPQEKQPFSAAFRGPVAFGQAQERRVAGAAHTLAACQPRSHPVLTSDIAPASSPTLIPNSIGLGHSCQILRLPYRASRDSQRRRAQTAAIPRPPGNGPPTDRALGSDENQRYGMSAALWVSSSVASSSARRQLERPCAAMLMPSSAGPSDLSPSRFEQIYRRSIDHPEEFWAEAAAEIDWVKPWDQILDGSRAPFFRWFAGGRLNTCYNALDRHAERGRVDQLALIYDSPLTDTAKGYTYRELRDEVARFAGALRRLGVERGDRVVIYMPNVPEAVIAMLACA
jgi:Acetyl-coenzyme A synthetase N-terminus/AMP-binding enzyme